MENFVVDMFEVLPPPFPLPPPSSPKNVIVSERKNHLEKSIKIISVVVFLLFFLYSYVLITNLHK